MLAQPGEEHALQTPTGLLDPVDRLLDASACLPFGKRVARQLRGERFGARLPSMWPTRR